MSENCKPKYKNLNRIQSFSDQRYATLDLFNQMCQNDEWLKQNVEKLSYLTPPAVRKRYSPILIDEAQSYGYAIQSNNNIVFSNKTDDVISIDLHTLKNIDESKSDVKINSTETEGVVTARAVVGMSSEEVITSLDTAHPDWGKNINSFWYVGFDKNKPYFIQNKWVKNPKSSDIPSVARAQTFKCTTSGLLESVTLALQNTGELSHNWSSPLYVQIWPTTTKIVKASKWNSDTKQNEPIYIKITDSNKETYKNDQHYKKVTITKTVTNKKTKKKTKKTTVTYKKDKNGDYVKKKETVIWPKGSITKPLAEAIYNPDKTTPGNFAFVFDHPVKVEKNKSYTIVMFSPLSHPQHCPRIGGYGRNCNTHKYASGDAFLSENNGKSWIKYGSNDTSAESYKFGKYTPQDFTFQCKINNYSQGYDTTKSYYLYMKPILTNPISSFNVAAVIEHLNEHCTVEFEYSTTGEDWKPIYENTEEYFTDSKPILLCVRAKLTTNTSDDSPAITSMKVNLKTDPASEMYVRTHYYDAKLTPMLGASLWGRIYAPFDLTPNDSSINCNVELIQKESTKEHFMVISVSELDEYLEVVDKNGEIILDSSKISGKEDDERCQYLLDNPQILTRLRESTSNIYIKPYETSDGEEYHLLSFDGGLDEDGDPIVSGFKLTNSPAYPIQSCVLEPSDGSAKRVYGEWYDYTVDYDTDELFFNQLVSDGNGDLWDVFENMPEGALCVEYNHVFIQDLNNFEVGTRINEETGLEEEGFVLDYFKQDFIINESNVETRRVSLRCTPVDPLREVILNKDTDNELLLYEDKDFTVDYINKELVFPVKVDGETSILKVNDTLSVVYTPNLQDTSIAIGYRAKRSNLNSQCIIKPNYFEYKV